MTLLLVAGLVGLFPLGLTAAAPPRESEALVVPGRPPDWKTWVDGVEKSGGRIPIAFPPDAFIVRGDAPLFARLRAAGDRVFQAAPTAEEVRSLRGTATLAAAAWGRTFAASAEPAIALRLDPDMPDALTPPASPQKTGPAASTSAAPAGAGFYDTSEFLVGKVAVGLVLPESDGSIDLNREDWTTQEIGDVVSGVQSALAFLASLHPTANVSYYLVVYDSIVTSYEPIHRRSWTNGEQALWINECMDSLGFSTGDIFYRTRAFDNSLRDSLDADWGVTMFIVDSSQDSDGRFADFAYAYAYLGGPFTVLTYDNWTWGIANLNAVAAHEMLHPFYALDEYTGGNCNEQSGYLGTDNQNQVPSCASDVLCLMRSDLTGAFAADSVCWYTRGHVGWRDTDGDAILDILDTNPATTLDAFPDTTDSPTPTLTGTAQVTFLTNVNPRGQGNEITTAFVSGVQYRIDGGIWKPASASDGAWDEATEGYSLTTDSLLESPHTIDVRAVSSPGNADTSSASDSFVVRDLTPPLPVTSFSVVARDTTITLYWTGAASADYEGVRIRYRTDSFPTSPTDGILFVEENGSPGAADSAFHSGVIPDTTYYYAAFARDEVPNHSAAATVLAAPLDPAPPAALDAPVPGSLYNALLPTFRWSPSVPEAGDTTVAYWMTLADNAAFASPLVDSEVVMGAPADTAWTLLVPLARGTPYFVRLRAKDASSGTYGFASSTFSFTTRIPVDSVSWRPESASAWSNFASAETLAAATNARIEVAFRPADTPGLGGHAGRVEFTTNGGASWDSLPLAWDHATADTGFFRATLTFGEAFQRHETVGFRVEGWDPPAAATPSVDDGAYFFVAGANPIAGFHLPATIASGSETMRDPLIGNLLDSLYTFEIAAPIGALTGAALRLAPAAGGPFVERPAPFAGSGGGNDVFRCSIDTVFAAEDSIDYYFVLWGSSLYDTTYVAGTDTSSVTFLSEAQADSAAFRFRVGTLTSVAGNVASAGAGRPRLEQNWPNPFGPRTVVAFDVGRSSARARLAVYDASGRLVRVLVDAVLPPGRHEAAWDAIGLAGQPVSSGVYLYELQTDGAREVRRMTILR